ncbi:MAG: thiolase family protein [Clostridiales Family XIII bacterium]|nr:thiolase family protein [Clostridiales Family XIII bacterium]
MTKSVITGAVRTAVGGYLGSLKTVDDHDLLAPILTEALVRSGIGKEDVDEVIAGNVLSKTPNLARIALLLAGFDISVPGYTVDRQCGSSLQAVRCATQYIATGEAGIILAGGAENMSRAPYYMPSSIRYQGVRINRFEVEDGFEFGSAHAHPVALYPNLNMGITAENVAEKHGITRQMQDEFAVDSHRKATEARAAGKFKDEILPIEVKERKSSFIFDQDEHMKEGTTLEGLAKLRPVFKKDGTVTPGNASGMNDGASAVVVMSEEKAQEKGVKPLVRIVSTAVAGVDPSVMGLGPVPSSKLALERAGLTLDDIDLFELNEAFAAQALGVLIELGLEPGTKGYERVNVNGGAVAHGHALGNSGTRILTTLIYEMKRRNVQYGLATLCIGGGQGITAIVENV